MIELALCIYLTYKNGQLAKSKGESSRKWILISVFAFIMTYGMAVLIAISISHNGSKDFTSIMKFLYSNPARLILISVIGFGGLLLVRYFIEHKKDTSEEEDIS